MNYCPAATLWIHCHVHTEVTLPLSLSQSVAEQSGVLIQDYSMRWGHHWQAPVVQRHPIGLPEASLELRCSLRPSWVVLSFPSPSGVRLTLRQRPLASFPPPLPLSFTHIFPQYISCSCDPILTSAPWSAQTHKNKGPRQEHVWSVEKIKVSVAGADWERGRVLGKVTDTEEGTKSWGPGRHLKDPELHSVTQRNLWRILNLGNVR